MKTDIQSRRDIELLINTFYNKAKCDDTIGFFFTDVIEIDWEKHLPVMYNFWEDVVFHTNTYQGNPMEKHMQLHRMSTMNAGHFQRWTHLFVQTVDEYFSGDKAELIKQRAQSIATLMQIKIHQMDKQ